MNIFELFEATKTDELSLEFCQSKGLIPFTMHCEKCLSNMDLVRTTKTSFSFRWRCKRPCRVELSIRKNTFFENSKLPIKEILFFIYFWAYDECSVKKIKRELSWQTEAIVNWRSYMREICGLKIESLSTMIGGIGHTVQIDESLFVRRKYNRGRLTSQQWAFAGIDDITKECFIVCVDRRDASTLLPIIVEKIAPGTTIVSDLWGAYNTIENFDHNHLTVNHSLNFVDPVTLAHTNRVENLWMRAKRRNKRECGTRTDLLNSYFQEFIWRSRYSENSFENILRDISLFYSN